MKKLIVTFGLAAATVLAVQAQETPAAQQDQDNATEQEQDQEQDQDATSTLEGMEKITEADLPESVTTYISDKYQNATIGEAYEISGTALSRILSNRSGGSSLSAPGDPDKLFQVQVTTEDDEAMMLYLTDDGKLFDRTSL